MKSTISRPILWSFASIGILLFGIAGCDILDTEESVQTGFQSSISGEFNGVMEGEDALYGEVEDADDIVAFQFISITREIGVGISMIGMFDEIPGPGEYEITEFVRPEDDDFDEQDIFEQLEPGQIIAEYVVAQQYEEDYDGPFFSENGVLTIEENDGDLLVGEFDFGAYGFLEEEPEDTLRIQADGWFDAAEGDF